MVSRILSMAGLFALILTIGFMFGPGPDGATVFRIDRLVTGLLVAVGLFIAAAKMHRQ